MFFNKRKANRPAVQQGGRITEDGGYEVIDDNGDSLITYDDGRASISITTPEEKPHSVHGEKIEKTVMGQMLAEQIKPETALKAVSEWVYTAMYIYYIDRGIEETNPEAPDFHVADTDEEIEKLKIVFETTLSDFKKDYEDMKLAGTEEYDGPGIVIGDLIIANQNRVIINLDRHSGDGALFMLKLAANDIDGYCEYYEQLAHKKGWDQDLDANPKARLAYGLENPYNVIRQIAGNLRSVKIQKKGFMHLDNAKKSVFVPNLFSREDTIRFLNVLEEFRKSADKYTNHGTWEEKANAYYDDGFISKAVNEYLLIRNADDWDTLAERNIYSWIPSDADEILAKIPTCDEFVKTPEYKSANRKWLKIELEHYENGTPRCDWDDKIYNEQKKEYKKLCKQGF